MVNFFKRNSMVGICLFLYSEIVISVVGAKISMVILKKPSDQIMKIMVRVPVHGGRYMIQVLE